MKIIKIEEEKVYLTEEEWKGIKLNNLQKKFKEEFSVGENLAVVSGTGTGKSFCGYLAMENYENPLYLVPTERLKKEKEEDLKKFSLRGTVMTYYELTMRLRRGGNFPWDFAVLDEIHEILSSALPLECFLEVYEREVPFLMLSATVNPKLLAEMGVEKLLFAPKLSWRRIVEDRIVKISRKNKKFPETLAKEIEKGTLVILPSIKSCWETGLLFDVINETTPEEPKKEYDKKVGIYHSEVPPEEREKVIKAFEEGKIDALIGTIGLTTGVNLPARKGVIVVAKLYGKPNPQPFQVEQARGRIARPLEGKEEEARIVTLSEFEEGELRKMLSPENLPSDVPYLSRPSEELENAITFCTAGGFSTKKMGMLMSLSKNPDVPEEVLENFVKMGILNEDLNPTETGEIATETRIPPSKLMKVLETKEDIPDEVKGIYWSWILSGKPRTAVEVLPEASPERPSALAAEEEAMLYLKKIGLIENGFPSFFAWATGMLWRKGIRKKHGGVANVKMKEKTVARTVKMLKDRGLIEFEGESLVRGLLSASSGIHPRYSLLSLARGIDHTFGNLLSVVLARKGIKEVSLFDVDAGLIVPEIDEETMKELSRLVDRGTLSRFLNTIENLEFNIPPHIQELI